MTTPSFRDIEQISALLDGQLPRQAAARLELSIASDPELSALYRQLSQSRALLRKLPARRAPRNFILTPKMVGVKAPTPRSVPFFRLASVFASLLLVLTFAANGLGSMASGAPAAAPAYGLGGAPMAESMAQPAEPAPPEEFALESNDASDELPTIAAAPMLESGLDAADKANAPAEAAIQPLAEEPAQSDEMPLAKNNEEDEIPFRQMQPAPARVPFQVSDWLQVTLLLIALLAGGAAWYVNRQANARFTQKNKNEL